MFPFSYAIKLETKDPVIIYIDIYDINTFSRFNSKFKYEFKQAFEAMFDDQNLVSC